MLAGLDLEITEFLAPTRRGIGLARSTVEGGLNFLERDHRGLFGVQLGHFVDELGNPVEQAVR